MNTIVQCTNLTKVFKDKKSVTVALDGISFTLEQGKITGLLGPDAAGKTTLLRVLTGLLHPTSGSVTVLDFDVARHPGEVQRRVGYLPQKFGLYENLSVIENLRLYADLHQVTGERRQELFTELLQMTDLARFEARMAGALSGGMKQKLALACALVSTPPLLILDEATVGVDVLSRRELWQILRKLATEQNMTILASTAYMDEADYCDRNIVLFEGKIIASDTPAALKNKAASTVANPTFEQAFQILLSGKVLPPLTRKNPVLADAEVLVKAEHLVKKFGHFTAVDNVSFNVRRGEIFGLLGANGAGKTTTFRMLCGLSAANEGNIEIAGVNLRTAAGSARAKIGFVAQKFSLYADLNVYENLSFFGGAYGLTPAKKQERINWALDNFELAAFRNRSAGKLPLGYKQRLSMACALLHEPEILFLDEATSGADPVARHEFWSRIMNLADSGVAVIITTHFLDEAAYCDRMVIMQNGVAIAAGSVSEIRESGRLTTDNEPPVLEDAFINIISKFRKERFNK